MIDFIAGSWSLLMIAAPCSHPNYLMNATTRFAMNSPALFEGTTEAIVIFVVLSLTTSVVNVSSASFSSP